MKQRILRAACAAVLIASIGCGERDVEEIGATYTTTESAVDASAPADAGIADESAAPDEPRGLVSKLPGVTPGYVLFSPLLSDRSYLIDNDGQVVHVWQTTYAPGCAQYLLPNGHLLRAGRDPDMLGFRAGGVGGILQELDWNGNVVWEWRFSNEDHVLHHDVQPLANGNLLAIAWEAKTKAQTVAAGRHPDTAPEQGLWPDWVLEIEPLRPDGARIVWEWHAWDHLVQDNDAAAPNYANPAAHPGRLDLNAAATAQEVSPEELAQLKAIGYVPEDAEPEDLESDFLHINAISYNPRLDQIALSVPELGEVWIIDHGISSEDAAGAAGDLLYRWGNPAVYGRGDDAGKRLFFQHDVRWVPDGWEGAGNLMVLNNGEGRPDGSWTSVDEWTPPLGSDGRYATVEGAAWGPSELAWQYRAEDPESMFSPFISGANRIHNGNTLICVGKMGRFLEVTRRGEVVWEYWNPYSGAVRNADGSSPQPDLEKTPHAVFRATRIAADHPGLSGRSLAALDPQPEAWSPPVEVP